MNRDELLEAMENTINDINQVKEKINQTGEPSILDQLRRKLKELVDQHFRLIDQLG
ncbi:hypothetical protein Pmgp_01189 [Pelotomaculum propionicicum]|uniref:Uncharacterized protein n=2 Tax=Pelotomaculum propionicicum TaxID=258475 RepID=A0A4Y7RT17_9FIRM|nr:hypothetical protein Pmgp_01189 [Pelotomaculum propionicicum]